MFKGVFGKGIDYSPTGGEARQMTWWDFFKTMFHKDVTPAATPVSGYTPGLRMPPLSMNKTAQGSIIINNLGPPITATEDLGTQKTAVRNITFELADSDAAFRQTFVNR